MNRNNTSFQKQITTRLKDLHSIYEKDNNWRHLLNYYQYIARDILLNDVITDSRGILLYFSMGMGKTRTAASIAASLNTQVIVILPKSLQDNFEDTVAFLEQKTMMKPKNIRYVSMDAYNASHQLDKKSTIDNSLIIIDEAHNFFRAIINGSQESNAYKIYQQIMDAKNVKLLFLTGTPISKNPFELVPCANMLAGFDLLPIQYDNFVDLYIDVEHRDIKNKPFLANRLVGLVSYMTATDNSMFPTELPLIISKIEMSTMQYRKYLLAREKEEADKKNQYIKSEKRMPMSLPRKVSMSSYYIRSRSMSNYAPPLAGDDITDENSPKMVLIANRVLSAKGLSLIYSQFVNEHGLKQLAYYLSKVGFKEFTEKSDSKELRYAMYTGDTNIKNRHSIISVFNSDKNKHGEYIKALLISKTGAEGLDLKNIRETHQIEPYWDLARDKQVIARAVRYRSHSALPEDERTVQPYLYISVANQKIWSSLKEREAKTIDEIFHDKAIEQYAINTKFNDLLKEVSIECSYFKTRSECYVCNPTNEKLFKSTPLLDLKMSNPCTRYEETEKNATRIEYEGNDYYYTMNPMQLYKYDPILDGFVEIHDDAIRKYIENT